MKAASSSDEQIGRLDQLDAELVGQERVLVEGRVEAPRREQDHGRVVRGRARRDRAQGGEERVRIVLDRRDPVPGEQLREEAHHRLPVLQHIRDPGRDAGIVLEDVERLLVDADDVDPGDVHVDAVRRLDIDHLEAEMGIAVDEVLRDDAGPDAFLGPVHVAQEGVDGADPLLEPALEEGPFRLRQHPRDDVERDEPLGRFVVPVDREGDAELAEEQLRLAAPGIEHVGGRLVEPAFELRISGAGRVLPVRGARHLIERGARHATLSFLLKIRRKLRSKGRGRRASAGASGLCRKNRANGRR